MTGLELIGAELLAFLLFILAFLIVQMKGGKK
jgi:hypothetical protein